MLLQVVVLGIDLRGRRCALLLIIVRRRGGRRWCCFGLILLLELELLVLLDAIELVAHLLDVVRGYEYDAVDDVEHGEHGLQARLLNVHGHLERLLLLLLRHFAHQLAAAVAAALLDHVVRLVHLVHLLLQEHGLLGEVLEHHGALLGALVLLAQERPIDLIRLALVHQRRPEVAATRLQARHQMIGERGLHAARAKVLLVALERLLQVAQRVLVLGARLQDEAQIAVDETHLRMVFAHVEHEQVARTIEQAQRVGHLAVGERVESQVSVLGDGLRVVDAEQAFAHHDRLVLGGERLAVLAEYVVEARQEAQTHADLRVEGAIDVVEQIVGLGDELVAVLEEALLDLGLAVGEEAVGVAGLRRHVLHHREHVEDVVVVEGLLVLALHAVVAQHELHAVLGAERAEKRELAQAELGERRLVVVLSVFENATFHFLFNSCQYKLE